MKKPNQSATTIMEAVRDGTEIRCEKWPDGMIMRERLLKGPPGLGDAHEWEFLFNRRSMDRGAAVELRTEDILRTDWQVVTPRERPEND